MAILSIRTIGDPVLRTETKPVDEITDQTKKLIENMKDTMYDASGVGLAAPQVGISKQIIIVDVGDGPLTLINPEIVDSSGAEIDEEGCLSIPGENGKVERASKIVVEALNSDGEEVEIEAEGLLARALQHEIDHLEGTLFVDKVK
ncbi:peptide deformylase [Sporohalobacter salinus]|uniref:peptide deformylase n=1 Tax=Sporohalobacter salinus TaxID=1494606 RepID=UPI001960AD4D|nr:peptide deformylase [Sporohalobacter salinus]MBM7623305.1 peptide deformylase [Sporohalobacter salinus]